MLCHAGELKAAVAGEPWCRHRCEHAVPCPWSPDGSGFGGHVYARWLHLVLFAPNCVDLNFIYVGDCA